MKIWKWVKGIYKKLGYTLLALKGVFIVAFLLFIFSKFMSEYYNEEALENLDIIGLCIAGGVYLIEELKTRYEKIEKFHKKNEEYLRTGVLFSIICPLLGHVIHKYSYCLFSWVTKITELGSVYSSIVTCLVLFYIFVFIFIVINKGVDEKIDNPQQPVSSNNSKDMNSEENHDDNFKIKKEKETIEN